jgi:uncharacterized membrane protein YjfL (UPF0719 family)
MNEIFDKLLIRFLFTLFICFALFLYKYFHVVFFPTSRRQLLAPQYPLENTADIIHFFSRILGIGIIFSALEFNEYIGILISLFHFFVWGVTGIVIYFFSLYITESIIFYNFNYKTEILKRENFAYSVISFVNSVCVATLIRAIFIESESSLVLMIILWLLVMVIYGFITKLFRFVSKFHFSNLLRQKSIALSFSYSSFFDWSCPFNKFSS